MSRILSLGNPEQLDYPSATLLMAAAPLKPVGGWTGDARPVEVGLTWEPSGYDTIPPTMPAALCGAQSSLGTADPRNPGFFKIEYGCGSRTRVRFVDLATARLYLGVCSFVRVSAARWRGTSAWIGGAPATGVAAASISEAEGGNYDELTSTVAWLTTAGAPINFQAYAPVGTYAVQFSHLKVWGTAEPVMSLYTDMENVCLDIANYSITPSYRRFMCTHYAGASSSGINALASFGIFARFFLNI